MAISSVFQNGFFPDGMFNAGRVAPSSPAKAAANFSSIFTTIVAQQMRESFTATNDGPLGIGGGTTGNIFGAFFDQAMGHALANSPAMASLNQQISSQLAGNRQSIATTTAANQYASLASVAPLGSIVPASALTSSAYTTATLPQAGEAEQIQPAASDARGPLLLPPAALPMAPQLPPPSPIED